MKRRPCGPLFVRKGVNGSSHKDPDASKITRFKQDFLPDLQSVFDNLVDITEPICLNIDNNLPGTA
mgnify:CR=1 FL=1